MIMSESELSSSIWEIVADLTSSDQYVALGLDIKACNQSFREEMMLGLFSDFDDLFGFINPIYRRAHTAFYDCPILVRHLVSPPPVCGISGLPLPAWNSWTGHVADFEGLRQKEWTVATACAILLVLHNKAIQGRIIAQGDNQNILCRIPPTHRLLVMRPSDPTPKGFSDFLSKEIKDVMNNIGLELRLEECWHSLSLFIYNKGIHIDKVQASGAVQKLTRMTGFNNSISLSLESDVSSIFSTSEVATSSDTDWINNYVMVCFHAILQIRRTVSGYEIEESEDPMFWAALLSIPKVVGGFPIILPINYAYRGDYDEFS